MSQPFLPVARSQPFFYLWPDFFLAFLLLVIRILCIWDSFKNISYFCLLYGHSDYLVFFLTKYTVCTEFLYDVFFH
jgi:hypothetical protein